MLVSHGAAHNRIDFLFAKAYAIYNQVTVSWSDAYASAGSLPGPNQYSDHRVRRRQSSGPASWVSAAATAAPERTNSYVASISGDR